MDLSDEVMEHFMNLAVKESYDRPTGFYVGAVLVSDSGKIIGRGHRGFLGQTNMLMHAERMAIEDAYNKNTKGSTLFTTLEPCVQAKQNQVLSPCCSLIARCGISTVVYGLKDSKWGAAGEGVKELERRGISVIQYFGWNDFLESIMHISRDYDNYGLYD